MAWFLAAADFSDRNRLWHPSGLSGNFSTERSDGRSGGCKDFGVTDVVPDHYVNLGH
jgi:hypothetical protein